MKKGSAKNFFTHEEKDSLIHAIYEAEKQTSGRICIHLDSRGKGDVMARAKKAFEKLGMAEVKHRNSIIIYLSLSDKTFAILGDQGIHACVGDQFWKEVASKMTHAFSENNFVEGTVEAIDWLGAHLKKHFPREAGDISELPD